MCLALLLLAGAMNTPHAAEPAGQDTGRGSSRTRERDFLEFEYRYLQTELLLDTAEVPYLVLDLERGMITIKLKGAVVWSSSVSMDASDTVQVNDFIRCFRGSGTYVMRPITHTHLFTASKRIPDADLVIVSQVTRAPPEELQRSIPGRFQIRWGSDLALEITTDVEGGQVSVLGNAIEEMCRLFRSPLGESVVLVKMNPLEALTLYHSAVTGMPTMLSSMQP